MSFGRNPHAAKALLAEQKAETSTDASSAAQAWRDAARLWERAAERETNPKRREEYLANAERTRAEAEGPPPVEEPDPWDLPN